MSDYGIKVGYYIFPNKEWDAEYFPEKQNNHGRVIYIPKVTKKYVWMEIYNYYDNNIWLDPSEALKFGTEDTIRFKRKMTSTYYNIYHCNGVELDDDHYQENL